MNRDAPNSTGQSPWDVVRFTLVDPDRCLERVTEAGGKTREAQVPWPEPHVVRRFGGATRLFYALKGATKHLVRLVYVFPLLLLLKAVLWALDIWLGDAITVVFVGLLVALFALVALLVGLYPLVGVPSRRRGAPALDLEAVASLARARGGPKPGWRATGAVDAGAPDEPLAAVVADYWFVCGDRLARLLLVRGFALCGGDPAPLVVEPVAAPLLLQRYGERSVPFADSPDPELCDAMAHWLKGAGEEELARLVRGGVPTQGAVVRDGDQVELIAATPPRPGDGPCPTAHGRTLRLHGADPVEGSPYRGEASPWRRLQDTPESPLVIKVTGPAR